MQTLTTQPERDGVRVIEVRYAPRGNHKLLFRIGPNAPEVICSGPAGTGKSRAVMELLFHYAMTYPGARILICRKTRESITNSIQPIWENQVLPPESGVRLHNRDQRYNFPNGSMVVLAGLNKDTRLFSAEYEIIYVNECNELTEGEWETLNRAIRSGVMPFRQLIGDMNPDAPTHWAARRIAEGKAIHIQTRHVDNPKADAAYMARLKSLTGIRRDRLYLGKWVAAEGQVYPAFEQPMGTHVFDRYPNGSFEPPASWEIYWGFDFGYTDPFVWHDWRKDEDGRLWLHREIYMTGRTIDEHAEDVARITAFDPNPPRALICDWDAGDRAVLEKHLGRRTTAAFKDWEPTFDNVTVRLKVAGDKRPRLMVNRLARLERDPELWDKKYPTSTQEEYAVYIWDKDPTEKKRKIGDRPVDRDNHGMDVTRYVAAHVDQVRRGITAAHPPVGLGQVSRWAGQPGLRVMPSSDGNHSDVPAIPRIVVPKGDRIGFGSWRPRFGR